MDPIIQSKIKKLEKQNNEITNDKYNFNYVKNKQKMQLALLHNWNLSSNLAISYGDHGLSVNEPSIKITNTVAGTGVYVTRYNEYSYSFFDMENCVLGIWVDDVSKLVSLTVYISSILTVTSLSTNFSKVIPAANLFNGMNYIKLYRDDFSNTGSEVWENCKTFRLRMDVQADAVTSIDIVSFDKNQDAVPKVLFTFDDGYANVYDKVLPMFTAKGIVGTVYVVPYLVGRTNYLTLEQLHALYDAGWDVGGHTYNHVDLTSVSAGVARTEISSTIDWLIENGFERAAYHMAYPESQYNSDVIEIAKECGIKSIRWGGYTNLSLVVSPPQNIMYNLPSRLSMQQTSVNADITGAIDTILKVKTTGIIVGHNIADVSSDTYTVNTSVLQTGVNYVDTKKVGTSTISKWYNHLTDKV